MVFGMLFIAYMLTTAESKISDVKVTRNPGCYHDSCLESDFNRSIIQIAMSFSDDRNSFYTVLWRGMTEPTVPSITMFKSPLPPMYDWDCLIGKNQCSMSDHRCGYMLPFNETSAEQVLIDPFSVVLDRLIYRSGKSVDIAQVSGNWTLEEMSKDSAKISGQMDGMKLTLAIRVDPETDRDTKLPHMSLVEQAVLIDISLSGPHTIDGDHATGVRMSIMPLWMNGLSNNHSVRPLLNLEKIRTLADDHMSGVYQLNRIGIDKDIQVRWRPVAFRTSSRRIVDWMNLNSSRLLVQDNTIDYLNSSAIDLLLCPPAGSYVHSLNYSFVAADDDHGSQLSNRTKPSDLFASWTLAVGFGFPRVLSESFSPITWAILAMVIVTPFLVAIVTEVMIVLLVVRCRSSTDRNRTRDDLEVMIVPNEDSKSISSIFADKHPDPHFENGDVPVDN